MQEDFSKEVNWKELAMNHAPKHMIIGCCDARVPPDRLTGTKPGEIFIYRNIANVVTPADISIQSALQFAIDVVKVENIIVMGHTQCNGVRAAI
jgi:carbonic anhydrase